MLRQRAKLNWMKEGERCSRLFFKKVLVRRAMLKIHQLQTSAGVMLHDQDLIIQEFIEYYKGLLGVTGSLKVYQWLTSKVL